MIHVAKKTLNLIQINIEKDQGAAFRQALEVIMPKMKDAFRGEDSSKFRSHLGASVIGGTCSRELWYGFRWAKEAKFPDRILRLFNRGHLEEARFLAMLEICGFDVWYETEEGGQFRISDFGGHFGSALDGVVKGLPDVPNGEPTYGEFKTHNDKNFKKLVSKGLVKSFEKHYIQMQVCMKKMNLQYGLYLAVNKNDDELYGEIITLDNLTVEHALNRAKNIIFSSEIPAKINDSPGWFECKFCSKHNICHGNNPIEVNCRTCCHSTACEDGSWLCEYHKVKLSKGDQHQGCRNHVFNPHMLNGVEMVGGNAEENYIELLLPSGDIIKHGPNHIHDVELWNYIDD